MSREPVGTTQCFSVQMVTEWNEGIVAGVSFYLCLRRGRAKDHLSIATETVDVNSINNPRACHSPMLLVLRRTAGPIAGTVGSPTYSRAASQTRFSEETADENRAPTD